MKIEETEKTKLKRQKFEQKGNERLWKDKTKCMENIKLRYLLSHRYDKKPMTVMTRSSAQE